ncbi:MAG: hypothetical protein JXR96_26905 [Deltaproteobacteria bacterium]|nr:hypothetical protein [Deltaproteobacteria bacterium]
MERLWSKSERRALDRLDSPVAVQKMLDRMVYNTDPFVRTPRRVLKDRRAHCLDGALFAAAALRRLRHPPLLLDLRAVRDDDHVLAVFRQRGRWGAVAKSNFVGLRYREPVYRSLRELAMSYFDVYYNSKGERTLREFSLPLDLRRYDRCDWTVSEAGLAVVEDRIERLAHYRLLSPAMERALNPVDDRSRRAGMLGADPKGLYRPGRGS